MDMSPGRVEPGGSISRRVHLLLSQLLATPAGCGPVRCTRHDDHVAMSVVIAKPTASCPSCGNDSKQIHSRYTRKLSDLPCFGIPVRVEITVRRFRCTIPECSGRIFTERLPGFVEVRGRTTNRLQRSYEAIGYALGGEAGARMAAIIAMPTSPDTLLRRVKKLTHQPGPPPRIVGIDDWAWRKGQHDGTIIVDLERSKVIDLLSDREAATGAAWLKANPGVEIVSRDRSSAYAQAITDGSPNAAQIADCWHLLKNLREAVERLFEHQSSAVRESINSVSPPIKPSTTLAYPENGGSSGSRVSPSAGAPESSRQQAGRLQRQRRVDRFAEVCERYRQGHSTRRIAQDLRLSRCTVQRYPRVEACPDWEPGRPRSSRLDKYRDWIDVRLAESHANAVDLHRQLVEQGYRGSYGSVRRYVKKVSVR